MNRRHFLQGLASIGLSWEVNAGNKCPELPLDRDINEYEAGFAKADLDLVGRPRTWSAVRNGFHPVSPERVVILSVQHRLRFLAERTELMSRLWEYLQNKCSWCEGKPYSQEKLGVILQVMELLSTYYHRADDLEQWGKSLAVREALGSTGMGQGFGILHDFQHLEESLRINTPPVDWWLFLYPDGLAWDSFDAEPIYAMVASVFSQRISSHYLQVSSFISQIVRNHARGGDGTPTWTRHLARMDRIQAVRTFNLLVAREFTQQKEGRHHESD